jgi:SAM-dependent methyltransferase
MSYASFNQAASGMSAAPGFSFEEYIMGHTSEEYQRLRAQARAWEFATRRVFEKIRLRQGMTCLDVGCGPGEVMRLMGEVVGTSGHVVGLDADARIGNEAIAALRATGSSQFDFVKGTVENLAGVGSQRFDVVYARLLLIHLSDPVSALKKMYALTRPGGYIIVQDYDFGTLHLNRFSGSDELNKVLFETYEKSGRDIHIGSRLPAHFMAAGIGCPDGTDVAGIFAPLSQSRGMIESTYRSVLPHALKMGITTEAESQAFFQTLADADGNEFGYWPQLIGAWKRKPHQARRTLKIH